MSLQVFKPCYEAIENAHTAALPIGQAVRLGTNGNQVLPITATTQIVHGFVALEEITAEQDGQVYREGGDAIALAGGTIARGAALVINASGRVVSTTTVNAKCIGYAQSAASSGEQVLINFTRFNL